MAQWVKKPVAKPGDRNLIPRTHGERRKGIPESCIHTHIPTHTYTHKH